MKLTDIIEKGNEIPSGISKLFIASEDFHYGQLPILKDSLVYYCDYDKTIAVNMIEFSSFQKGNVDTLNLKTALQEEDRNYIVEKNSDCKLEVTTLESGWRGIWHQNHFDEWNKKFQNHFDRIKKEPSLKFSGITFSSLMYNYNVATNSLFYFINTKPYEYQIGKGKIVLPELLEVSITKATHGLLPIVDIEYLGIKIKANSPFDFDNQTGIVEGNTAEEFTAEIENYPNIKTIIISKYNPIKIALDGTLSIPLTKEGQQKIEWFKIIKK